MGKPLIISSNKSERLFYGSTSKGGQYYKNQLIDADSYFWICLNDTTTAPTSGSADWQVLSAAAPLDIAIPIEGGTYNLNIVSGQVVIELTEVVGYNFPLISTLDDTLIYNIKNISGGAVTMTLGSGDTLQGASNFTLYNYDNYPLYIATGTTFELL